MWYIVSYDNWTTEVLKWPNELTACINKLNKKSNMPNIFDKESKQTNWKNNNQKDETENKQTAKMQPKRWNGKQTRQMIGLRAWVVHQVDPIIGIVEILPFYAAQCTLQSVASFKNIKWTLGKMDC